MSIQGPGKGLPIGAPDTADLPGASSAPVLPDDSVLAGQVAGEAADGLVQLTGRAERGAPDIFGYVANPILEPAFSPTGPLADFFHAIKLFADFFHAKNIPWFLSSGTAVFFYADAVSSPRPPTDIDLVAIGISPDELYELFQSQGMDVSKVKGLKKWGLHYVDDALSYSSHGLSVDILTSSRIERTMDGRVYTLRCDFGDPRFQRGIRSVIFKQGVLPVAPIEYLRVLKLFQDREYPKQDRSDRAYLDHVMGRAPDDFDRGLYDLILSQWISPPIQGSDGKEILLKKATGELPAEQVIVVVHPASGPAFAEMSDLVVAVMEEGAKWGIPSIFLPEGDPYQDERYQAVATLLAHNNFGRFAPAFIASAGIFMGGHLQGCLDSAIRSAANAAFKRDEKVFRARLFPDTIYTTDRAGRIFSLSERLASVPSERRLSFLRGELDDASFGAVPLVKNASISLAHGGETMLVQAGDPEYNLILDVEDDAEEKTPDKPKGLRPRLAPNLFSMAARRGMGTVSRALVR